MPVVQLQNDTGENLGRALGTAAGYLATRKERAAKQQQATQEEQLRAQQIQSEIQKNNQTVSNTDADRVEAARQQNLFQQFSARVNAGPPKGVDPQRWAASLQAEANGAGLTDSNLRSQLIADGQATVAARAPKLSEVEHGLPQPVTAGKGAWTPQQMSQHYLQAAARAMNSDMPDEQKKIVVGQFQKMAADALSGQTANERERHDRAMEENAGRRTDVYVQGGDGRRGGGITPYENIEIQHWNQTHNPDGTTKSGASRDTSGLSVGGKELYDQDLRTYNRAMDTDPDNAPPAPDVNDPKYQHKADALGAKSGGGAATPQPQPTPGTKRSVSLKAAMALPGNRGKTAAQVQADIQAHGYSVTP